MTSHETEVAAMPARATSRSWALDQRARVLVRGLRKHWRWVAVAGTAALLVPRLARRHGRSTETQADSHTDPADPVADAARADRQAGEIVTLARHLVTSRNAATDDEREACLRRAAQIILEREDAAASFVEAHKDAFLRTSREKKSGGVRNCHQCGSPMGEATRHDPEVNDWMPVWACARCGAEVLR